MFMPKGFLDVGYRDILPDQVSAERMLQDMWMTTGLIDASTEGDIIEQPVDLRTMQARAFA